MEEVILERIQLIGDVLKKRIESNKKNRNCQTTSDQPSDAALSEAKQLYKDDTKKIFSADFEKIDKSEQSIEIRKQGPLL